MLIDPTTHQTTHQSTIEKRQPRAPCAAAALHGCCFPPPLITDARCCCVRSDDTIGAATVALPQHDVAALGDALCELIGIGDETFDVIDRHVEQHAGDVLGRDVAVGEQAADERVEPLALLLLDLPLVPRVARRLGRCGGGGRHMLLRRWIVATG